MNIERKQLKELILYELPFFAEYISIGFIQNIIAWYIAKKVQRKYNKYLLRKIAINNKVIISK